jgi:hypothetical protein
MLNQIIVNAPKGLERSTGRDWMQHPANGKRVADAKVAVESQDLSSSRFVHKANS